MPTLDVRLYDAFAAAPGGGNVGGVVYAPPDLDAATMKGLAAELGAPTTGFVADLGGGGFAARFFSPRAEMPMCGHVTVAIFASLFDDVRIGEGGFRLATGSGELPIRVERVDGRCRVAMRQPLPTYELFEVDPGVVAAVLGLSTSDVVSTGSAATGLRHLFVQVAGAEPLSRLRVADDDLRRLCQDVGIDTVGVFALGDGASIRADVRVRDLCHGVGDREEAASGTTNGALASLLWRRGLLPGDEDGRVVVVAEQGVEMGRPSRITTRLSVAGGAIEAVEVGGCASRRLEGRITC
jgi:trans-2,3-dihydro-3-hydroxyanthranilate isomerase